MSMKHVLLFPLVLLTSLSSFSCSDNSNKYKVDADEFGEILKLEGIELIQQKSEGVSQGKVVYTETQQFSPNAYYSVERHISKSETFSEMYVFKHDGQDPLYTKFERNNPDGKFSKEIPAQTYEFKTVDSVSNTLLAIYNRVEEAGLEFTFNKKEKCYVCTYSDPTQGSAESRYYFYNKKVIKCVLSIGTVESITSIELAYDDIIPQPPK